MSIELKIERVLQQSAGVTFCAECLAERAGLRRGAPDTLAGRLTDLMHRSRVSALMNTTFRHFTDRIVAAGTCDECGRVTLVVRKRRLPPGSTAGAAWLRGGWPQSSWRP